MRSIGFRPLYASALGFALVGLILGGCSGGSSSMVPSTSPGGSSNNAPANAPVTTGNQSDATNISVSDSDIVAASGASHFIYHILPPLTQKTTTTRPQSVVFPADLVFGGGAVLKTVVSHNIYLNAPSTEWGDPQGFLNDLNNSAFIHVTDQYVKSVANGRYKTGANARISHSYFLNLDNIVPQTDILAFVHATAKTLGSGYGNIYHFFLPHGYDTCFDGSNVCYSPDFPSTFAFCAYHASVTFSDSVGHVIFSVEPFQNVSGCTTADTIPPVGPQPPPNGQLKDSTDSTLSHEYFESITDPDPPTGWSNPVPGYPGEIGDLCRFNPFVVIPLNGHPYEIQREYSNGFHGCVD